jgi:hypothetical protein
MKFSVYETSVGARAAPAPPSAMGAGTSWAAFGREMIVYAEDATDLTGVTSEARGAPRSERRVAATREQLHVVVQHGRLFQQHHPDVPVIHDRGRFLLVQLDPDRARRLQTEAETCFGVMPLATNHVVFEERDRAAARSPVPFIRALADKPARATVEASLTKLVSLGTRHSTSAGFSSAATWARDQLVAMGYRTRRQEVAVDGGKSLNIIADQQGSGNGARKVVIVTAHLDSINLLGGPSAPAPGADDNGSGSTGLLEIARVFQDHQSVHDLRLILFGGEEQGLFGSKHYVASLAAAQRKKIEAVVNMDMVGSLNSESRSVLLEGANISQSVIDRLSAAAATYTELVVESSLSPFASDHVPFINAGIPAVLTIEGADNTNDTVHSGADILERIDYDLLLMILRMNVAFVAGVIGTAGES